MTIQQVQPRGTVERDGKTFSHYLSLVSVNGVQIGDDNTFGDWFETDELAVNSTLEFFQSEYPNRKVSVELTSYIRKPLSIGNTTFEHPAEKCLVITVTR